MREGEKGVELFFFQHINRKTGNGKKCSRIPVVCVLCICVFVCGLSNFRMELALLHGREIAHASIWMMRSDSDLNFKHPQNSNPVESKYATHSHIHTVNCFVCHFYARNRMNYIKNIFTTSSYMWRKCCVFVLHTPHSAPQFWLSSSLAVVFFIVVVVVARILISQTTGNHTKFNSVFAKIYSHFSCVHT